MAAAEGMTHEEALREVDWIAREARRIVRMEASRPEVAAYFDRKAALLEHIAGTLRGPDERRAAYEAAATARDNAAHLRAGLEWPRHGQTISRDVL